MRVNLFGKAELEVRLNTKSAMVRRVYLADGKIRAVKFCKDKYGMSLKEAFDYVKWIEAKEEINNAFRLR